MTKFVKLSLIASLALSSSVFADSLEEAFKASKVSGEIRSEYSNSNFLGQSKSDSIVAAGGSLGIVTGSYNGLTLGVTLQTSHVIDLTNNGDVLGAAGNDALDVQGSVLSESYLQYSLSKTTFKAGRQYIYTPLVSTGLDGKSSQSLIKDSFEAYIVTNTDIANTTVVAGYVSKYQAKRDATGGVGGFDKFADGAYTVYAKNTSIKDVTLTAQYLDVQGLTTAGDKDALYLQVDYKLGMHTLSAQYLKSTENNVDGQAYGLMSSGALGIGKLGYIVAYNASTEDAPVYVGAGTGTSDTLFTAMPVNGGGVPARANTDTLVGGVIVPVAGATVIAYGGQSSRDIGLGDVKAMGAIVIYPYGKNFLLKANYEHVTTQNVFTEDTNVARVYLSYKF